MAVTLLAQLPAAVPYFRWLAVVAGGGTSLGPPTDGFGEVVQALEGVAWVATTVAFCVFFYRSYANLDAFGVRRRYSPGWAPGSFFVPVVNLVLPYLIARELWAGSSAEGDRGRHGVVSLWWASFVAPLVLSPVALYLHVPPLAKSILLGTAEVVSLVGTFVAIALVRAISRRQTARAQQLAAERGAATPPLAQTAAGSSARG